MIDYKQGKIYKICSNQTEKIYIGSTCKSLENRFDLHKIALKRWKQGLINKYSSFDLLDKYNDCYIELIELYPAKDKRDLFNRERYFIEENINLVINKIIPSRTKKEYYESNKIKIKRNMKIYYEKNKDKILEQWNIKNDCECGGSYTNNNKHIHIKTNKHINYINKNNIDN